MKTLTKAIILVCVLQFGCKSNAVTKVELAQEQEAQKLLDGGLDFRRTTVQDGPALVTGCGFIDGTDYVSSDGVEVHVPNYRCVKAVDALHCFDDNLKDASEVFENEVILDSNQQPVGKRLVGARRPGQYFITYLAGVSCSTHTSPSLSHLLAFEKWRRTHQ